MVLHYKTRINHLKNGRLDFQGGTKQTYLNLIAFISLERCVCVAFARRGRRFAFAYACAVSVRSAGADRLRNQESAETKAVDETSLDNN